MTEIPLAFFVGLSLLFFLKGEKDVGSKHNHMYFGLSGLTACFSFWIKETGIILFFFYLTYFAYRLMKKRAHKGYVFTLIGFLLPLIFEGLYFLNLKSDFWFRYHKSEVFTHVEGEKGVYANWWLP
jgi:hypothetical protein